MLFQALFAGGGLSGGSVGSGSTNNTHNPPPQVFRNVIVSGGKTQGVLAPPLHEARSLFSNKLLTHDQKAAIVDQIRRDKSKKKVWIEALGCRESTLRSWKKKLKDEKKLSCGPGAPSSVKQQIIEEIEKIVQGYKREHGEAPSAEQVSKICDDTLAKQHRKLSRSTQRRFKRKAIENFSNKRKRVELEADKKSEIDSALKLFRSKRMHPPLSLCC